MKSCRNPNLRNLFLEFGGKKTQTPKNPKALHLKIYRFLATFPFLLATYQIRAHCWLQHMNRSASDVLMKIPLKIHIILDPLMAKSTPCAALAALCSSYCQCRPLQSLPSQLKSNTAAHSDTGWEFEGSQSCDK